LFIWRNPGLGRIQYTDTVTLSGRIPLQDLFAGTKLAVRFIRDLRIFQMDGTRTVDFLPDRAGADEFFAESL
jgi:hypothetical protein